MTALDVSWVLRWTAFAIVASSALGQDGGGGAHTFRSDYEYVSDTDAFYKLHVETASWQGARDACVAEGTALLSDAAEESALAPAHALMKRLPEGVPRELYLAADTGKVFLEDKNYDIDVVDLERDRFRTPLCNVLTFHGKLASVLCTESRPFVCQVPRTNLTYNERCQLYDPGYTYNATLRSCYCPKALPYSWGQALASCLAQGAHLAVLNSLDEARHVSSLVEHLHVRGAHRSEEYFWHIGFRSHPEAGDNVYRTIFNQTLEEAGYATWSKGEPNNYRDSEHCGSIFRSTAQLNDINCDHLHGFVCEKMISSP